ncbi:hypothetical protein Tco_1029960 [Tanacetum coccineum]|uniref:Uncharacterized protein n=1 Tax=Tanacetum coccineum TaxID=301880 RepID=A0ABQ5G513_9ASTR
MAITGSLHQSRIHNEKLVQTLLKGHSILSLEGSLSGDCDVEKNGKWSCIYAVGSQEYQMVCTRLDIASADVGMLDKFDRGLQTDVQVFVDFDYAMAAYMTLTGSWKKKIWLKGLMAESGYELSLVAGIAIGALVKGSSRSEVSAQVEDEELREFTSEYYIPFTLHPVVPTASASIADLPEGKVGCYTEKLDALRRWREMFFWVDDTLFPWDFAFYTQGSLPKDKRPPPGSYSMEDAELINENQMDLFSIVHLSKPKLVTEGVHHVSLGGSTSTEEEILDAPPTLAAKEVIATPPPNVEATSDSSAPVTHAGQQAALVAQLRARFSSKHSQSVQKDEEILLLKTQLADAQAEAESSRSHAQKLVEEKMALLVPR